MLEHILNWIPIFTRFNGSNRVLIFKFIKNALTGGHNVICCDRNRRGD